MVSHREIEKAAEEHSEMMLHMSNGERVNVPFPGEKLTIENGQVIISEVEQAREYRIYPSEISYYSVSTE